MSPLEEIGTSRHSIPSDTAQGSLPVASYDGQQLASVAAAHIAVINAEKFLNARSTADVSVVTTTEPSPVLQLPLAPASSLAESDGTIISSSISAFHVEPHPSSIAPHGAPVISDVNAPPVPTANVEAASQRLRSGTSISSDEVTLSHAVSRGVADRPAPSGRKSVSFATLPMATGRPPGKRAWPGGNISTSDKRQCLSKLLQRTAAPSTEQLRAAARAGLNADGSDVVVDLSASDMAQPPSQHQGDGGSTSSSSKGGRYLHVGSSRPHALDGDAVELQRVDRKAPSGSLRQLEPELHEVLLNEPLPRCNIPTRTDPEDPPPRHQSPPGPFSTAQLIPDKVVLEVTNHGRLIQQVLARCARGANGWKVMRRARPLPLTYSESEGINACGHGYVWRRRAHVDLWDAVQPSSHPNHRPDTALDADQFEKDAKAEGLKDKQLVSWMKHGFPGARAMPIWPAVVSYGAHVGALKRPSDLEDRNQRDIKEGFVSSGHSFPEFWPCRVDPMNIVVQHESARATIDKSINLPVGGGAKSRPAADGQPVETVPAYNDYIDLDSERATVPYKLITVDLFTRGVAILLTAGVLVEVGKFDLSAYFRMHGKQLAQVHQSGRLLQTLFGFDFRVNFGERDAPDHTGRASDGLAFFVRCELRRLGKQYPTKCARICSWVALRSGLAKDAKEAEDPEFIWAVLFFFVYYVDDAGLAAFADLLVDSNGEEVLIFETDKHGVSSSRQQRRSELYFYAAMGVVQRYNHLTPEKKQSLMAGEMVFLGVGCNVNRRLRLLSLDKRRDYSAERTVMLNKGKALQHGSLSVDYSDANSLLHKLLHACSVIAVGRPHLFYFRRCLKAANRLRSNKAILTAPALQELTWWESQLEKSDEHGLPFASRFDFPTFDDHTVTFYGDASREENDPEASGWGAWSVIDAVFVYIVGRWSAEEVRKYSINVLEAKTKNMAMVTFVDCANGIGLKPSHVLAFVDNSTAEAIDEFGRASTEGLNHLNLLRQSWLTSIGLVHQATERVASVDNDVADLLSRGDIAEALRFPTDCGLAVQRLDVDPAVRSMADIPPTWA